MEEAIKEKVLVIWDIDYTIIIIVVVCIHNNINNGVEH